MTVLQGTLIYLFFKKVYRRHTHYAKELVNIQFTKMEEVLFDHHSGSLLKRGTHILFVFRKDLECQRNDQNKSSCTVNILNSFIKKHLK